MKQNLVVVCVVRMFSIATMKWTYIQALKCIAPPGLKEAIKKENFCCQHFIITEPRNSLKRPLAHVKGFEHNYTAGDILNQQNTKY